MRCCDLTRDYPVRTGDEHVRMNETAKFEIGDEVVFTEIVPGVPLMPDDCPVRHFGLITDVDDTPTAAATANVLGCFGLAPQDAQGVLITVREHAENGFARTWILDASQVSLVAREPYGRLIAAARDVLNGCKPNSGPELRLRLAVAAATAG